MLEQNFTHNFEVKPGAVSKYLPNMNRFVEWLSRTKVTIAYDSFFRKSISIVLPSSIILINQPQSLFIYVDTDPEQLRKYNHKSRDFGAAL